MESTVACYPCLVNIALTAGNLSGLPEPDKQELMDFTLRTLLDSPRGTIAPRIAGKIFRHLKEDLLHDPEKDLYRELKELSNRAVRAVLPDFKQYILDQADRVGAALKVAAMGNAIDFAIHDHEGIDLRREMGDPDKLVYAVNRIPELSETLAGAKALLYIGDNAGEIILDGLVIGFLKERFPDLDITLAVRDTPVLNDATLEDARACGVDSVCRVISSGSRVPGTLTDAVSGAFLELFSTADVVISKGQGNYESLYGNGRDNLFFIFKIKCAQVARLVGGKMGELVVTT